MLLCCPSDPENLDHVYVAQPRVIVLVHSPILGRHEQMKLIPPAMLPETLMWGKILPWNRTNMTSNVLKGVAGSAGKVTGTARVLFGPEDFGKMKLGDVLVAVTTTPAWTPLFALASAIVTDIVGPLSHSSIVAREHGIPLCSPLAWPHAAL